MTTPPNDRLALLWDFDGVLNPSPPAGYKVHLVRPEGLATGRYIKAAQVWINPEHGAKMIALAENLNAENCWATTWRAEANRLLSPVLGLPPLRTLLLEAPTIYPDWKWEYILPHFEHRPLIWFDDEFDEPRYWEGREAFLRARGDTPTLLHRVDCRVGLRDEDFAAARDWAHVHGFGTPHD